MNATNQRAYNCKDEELPVICKFAVFSLKRDLADFTAFSPKFNQEFVTAFETKIASVNDLIMPRSETLDLKNITARLYATIEGLIDPINRVDGYLKMLNSGSKISSSDFGLSQLRKSVYKKHAESVINDLRTVSLNLTKYAALLAEQGLTPELSSRFSTASVSIAADNQAQYEITSHRKSIVQKNTSLFNSLNEQLNEILRVGKILYKATDAVKTKEYSFSSLKKQVSSIARQTNGTPAEVPASQAAVANLT